MKETLSRTFALQYGKKMTDGNPASRSPLNAKTLIKDLIAEARNEIEWDTPPTIARHFPSIKPTEPTLWE